MLLVGSYIADGKDVVGCLIGESRAFVTVVVG